jgi:hypothetical protein
MRRAILILTLSLIVGPVSAQQGYDFLKRDNPFGSAENAPQGPGAFDFCWMNEPVPNTKNIYITNVFPTQQSASTLKSEVDSYERGLGVAATFECTIDSAQAQNARFRQKIAAFSQLGYNIGRVNVRPH